MWGAQSRVEAAVRALRRGLPAIVLDDRERENEGDFVLLAEHATPEVVHFMLREGRGLLCAPWTSSGPANSPWRPWWQTPRIPKRPPLPFPSTTSP